MAKWKENVKQNLMQFHKKPYLPETAMLRYTTHMKRMRGSRQFKSNEEVVILRDVRSAADKLSAFASVDNWSQAILTELPLRVLS